MGVEGQEDVFLDFIYILLFFINLSVCELARIQCFHLASLFILALGKVSALKMCSRKTIKVVRRTNKKSRL